MPSVLFQRVWLPILAMEAASKTVQSGDPIACNNVRVSLTKHNDRYYGELHLPVEFCKKRCIKLFNNSKDAEEDASDYLCIRYHTGQVNSHALSWHTKVSVVFSMYFFTNLTTS